MSQLPARFPDERRSARQLVQAVRAEERTELAVYEHNLEARYRAEVDQIDSQAISDVVKAALEEEIAVLDWGLEQGKGSAAKAELVARKVAMLSKINDGRIARRFGG